MTINSYSAAKIPAWQKLNELLTIVYLMHLRRVFQPKEVIQRVFADFEDYRQLLTTHTNATLFT